jgi:hypothetical protein
MKKNPFVLQQQQESAHYTLIDQQVYDADWNSEETEEEEETTGHSFGPGTGLETGSDLGRGHEQGEGEYEVGQEEDCSVSAENQIDYSHSFDSLEGNLSFEVEEEIEDEEMEDTLDECLRDLAHSLQQDHLDVYTKRVVDSWDLLRELYMDIAAATNAACRSLGVTDFTKQSLGIQQSLPTTVSVFQLTAPFITPADLIRGRIEYNNNKIAPVSLDNLFIGDIMFQDFCIRYRYLISAHTSYTMMLEERGVAVTWNMRPHNHLPRLAAPRLVPGIDAFLPPKPKPIAFFHGVVLAQLEKASFKPEVVISSPVVQQSVIQLPVLTKSITLDSRSCISPTLPKEVENEDDIDFATIIDLYTSDNSFVSVLSGSEPQPTSVDETFVDTLISGCSAIFSTGWRCLSSAITYVKNRFF